MRMESLAQAAGGGQPGEAQSLRSPLPEPSLTGATDLTTHAVRRDVLAAKHALTAQRTELGEEYKHSKLSTERGRLQSAMQDAYNQALGIEQTLQEQFLPQHGTQQFLGTRALFVSPLFPVRSRSSTRAQHVELSLGGPKAPQAMRYRGPELRQSDALVFLALVHMLRDLRPGTRASFAAMEVCKTLYGRYDGDTRRQLREHIYRLQRGLLVFETFSVQLVLQFDYPARGPWTVALDPRIVQLFQTSSVVWLDIRRRLALPDGLASWLYGFVASQTNLIPWNLKTLKALCGSEASDKVFAESLRSALGELSRQNIIDSGWSVRGKQVRWRKPPC